MNARRAVIGQMCCKDVCDREGMVGYRYRPCGAKAKVERDGKPYCGRHDPVRIKAKADAKHMQRLAEQGAKDAARAKYLAEAAEQKRRAECYDDLLAELQNIANANIGEWPPDVRDQFRMWAQSRARAAIAKATQP